MFIKWFGRFCLGACYLTFTAFLFAVIVGLFYLEIWYVVVAILFVAICIAIGWILDAREL